jgi:hypothetical protein
VIADRVADRADRSQVASVLLIAAKSFEVPAEQIELIVQPPVWSKPTR